VSHRHFCPYSKHFFECDGTAIRLFDREPTTCLCPDHGTPIEEGNHSDCSIDHVTCPEHRRAHLIALGHNPDDPPDPVSLLSVLPLFSDADLYPLAGWCHWCLAEFRCRDRFESHKGDLWNNCLAFEALRNNKFVVEFLDAMDEFDFPDEESAE